MEDFKKLFFRWKREFSISPFVQDGIVSPDRYKKPHLLFVLRDMNTAEERSLCEDLARDGSGCRTWNNAARWTIALLDGDPVYPRRMPKESRAAAMRRTAVLNLKKSGGGRRADGSALESAVRTQKALIAQEIALCSPDLILACGLSAPGIRSNYDLLRAYRVLETGDEKEIPSLTFSRSWKYCPSSLGGHCVPIVEFCHPQVTVLEKMRGHLLFEALYRDMLEIRKKLL